MMHPVVRRCDEYIFNRSRELSDEFGMDPELVEYFYLMDDNEYNRIKTHHENRHKKYQF